VHGRDLPKIVLKGEETGDVTRADSYGVLNFLPSLQKTKLKKWHLRQSAKTVPLFKIGITINSVFYYSEVAG